MRTSIDVEVTITLFLFFYSKQSLIAISFYSIALLRVYECIRPWLWTFVRQEAEIYRCRLLSLSCTRNIETYKKDIYIIISWVWHRAVNDRSLEMWKEDIIMTVIFYCYTGVLWPFTGLWKLWFKSLVISIIFSSIRTWYSQLILEFFPKNT